EQNVYVLQVGHQQGGNQYRHDDDDTTHGRSSFFLQLSFKSQIANRFANLEFAQKIHNPAAQHHRNKQRKDNSCTRAEGNESPKSRTRQVKLLIQIFKQIVQHGLSLSQVCLQSAL